MTGLLLDLRYALRTLARAPGFTGVAVVTLALGIGANTSIFSFVNALLLRNLPVRAPEQLVWLEISDSKGSLTSTHSYRFYEILRDGDSPFQDVVARAGATVTMTAGESADRVSAELVTGDFFELLGVRSAAGRMLSREDDLPGAEPVVVLGYPLWRNRFAADPSIVGSKILLAGHAFTVAGVAAPGFHGLSVAYPDDLWVPMVHTSLVRRSDFDWRATGNLWLSIFGRIRTGVPREQAQAAADVLYNQFLQEWLATQSAGSMEQRARWAAGRRISLERVTAVSPSSSQSYRESFGMIAGAVGFLLLIACANVSNLLVARGVHRQQELAVRLASGASRWRLVRQLLVEGCVLGTLGGLLGALLAWHLSTGMVPLISQRAVVDVSPDRSVLAFTLGVSLLAVVVSSLFPSIRASRMSVAPALKGVGVLGESRGSLGSRGWLVASQFALCLPLLVGAGLLIRSIQNLTTQDVGFERVQRVQATLDPGGSGYDGERALSFFAGLLQRLQGQPGIESMAISHAGALGGSGWFRSLYRAEPGMNDSKPVPIGYSKISEGYFQTLGIPLLAGRDFHSRDDESAQKVMIVSQRLARELFGEQNPIGHRISSAPNQPPEFEVVGLVADTKYNRLREESTALAYFPFRQFPFERRAAVPMWVYLRTPMSSESAGAVIREQVRQLDRQLPVFNIRTLDEQIESLMRGERMMSTLLTTFGLLALIITAIGLYGVIAFDVNRRTREVGLRMALGALRRDILALVFRRAVPWVVGGIAVGLAAAAALTRLLEKSLFELSPLDPATYAFALLFLVACACAANYVPASRAARVEPMAALRHE